MRPEGREGVDAVGNPNPIVADGDEQDRATDIGRGRD